MFENILSGGLINEAISGIRNSINAYGTVNIPDLTTLIPQLQTMAVQGELTPASIAAVLQEMPGTLSPEEMQAVMAKMAGTMTPSQASAVFQTMPGAITPAMMQAVMAQVQGSMSPAQAQVVYNTMQGQMFAQQAEVFLYSVQGQMTPEQADVIRAVKQGNMEPAKAFAYLQPDSLMKNVQSDAQSLQAARQGLNQLQEIATNKGLTDADRAQLNAVMNQTNANAAGQREAQVNELRQQGLGGSGVELAARLSGIQGAANNNAMAGAQIAQSAQARALQALQASISGNQQYNQQLFQQNADKAKAQDAVNQFNAQARNTIGLANAQNQQQANAMNFNTANQIEMQNAAAQNQANISNAANRQQANAMNFNAMNQAASQNAQALTQNSQFNAQQRQAAELANFNMMNQIGMSNTAAQNQANQFNAGLEQQSNLANYNTQNQFALANAAAQNQAGQFNAGMQQQANLAQYDATNHAMLANAQFANSANQFNAGLQQQSNMANFQTANQFALANAANQQAANQFNAGQRQNANLAQYAATNQANQFNAQAGNIANQFNAGAQNQFNLASYNMANQVGMYNNNILNQQAQYPYQAAQANFNNALNFTNAQANAMYRGAGTVLNFGSQVATNNTNLLSNGLQALGSFLGIGDIAKAADGSLYKLLNGVWTKLTATETAQVGKSGVVNPNTGTTVNNPSAVIPAGYQSDGSPTLGGPFDTPAGWAAVGMTRPIPFPVDTGNWYDNGTGTTYDVPEPQPEPEPTYEDDYGYKDGGYVSDDLDQIIARMTNFRYRGKQKPQLPVKTTVSLEDTLAALSNIKR